jgi:hypothetical protein
MTRKIFTYFLQNNGSKKDRYLDKYFCMVGVVRLEKL